MKKNLILASIIIFIFSLTSCQWNLWSGDDFDYGKGQGSTNAKEVFTGQAPKYVTATQARFSDKIVVSWNPVTGADYYEVFRAETKSLSVDQSTLNWIRMMDAPVGSTRYKDQSAESGKYYVYRVRARSFALSSLIGDYSQPSFGWILNPPSNVDASQGADTKYIHVSWSAVENIRGYRVYWSETAYGGTWKVALPEGYEGYDYVVPGNVLNFAFVPAKKLAGTQLYFYVESISMSGDNSIPSVQRIGYTFVEGAPTAPANFVADRGVSTSSITLTWKEQYGTATDGSRKDFDWEIYRSAPGESEKKIYSTIDGDPMPEVVDGMMKYIDSSNLRAGVEYSYSIRAITELTGEDGSTVVATGLPSNANGFLFSPPVELEKIEAVVDGEPGFVFTFKDALGAKDNGNSNWSYSIYGKENLADEWTVLKEGLPVTNDASRTFFSPYNESSRYEYFTVKTSDGFKLSLGYDEVVGEPISIRRPVAADAFNASDNGYYDNLQANGAGAYPVFLTMIGEKLIKSYNVRVWDREVVNPESEGYKEYKEVPFDVVDPNKNIIRISDVDTTDIGSRHYYAVQGVDVLGRTGAWSVVDSGYSAITNAMLIRQMQIYAMKPWEFLGDNVLEPDVETKWRNSTITSKIQSAGTSSLTDGKFIYESGKYSGRLGYSAAIKGIGGLIRFSLEDFGEAAYIRTNGNYTMDVDAGGSGSCNGALEIRGMYPASVGFGNISVSNQKFVGTYTVNQKNGMAGQEVSPNQ